MIEYTELTEEIWLEAECGNLGSNWSEHTDVTASRNKYVEIQSGLNSTGSAPTGVDDRISYTFDVTNAGNYQIWGRVKAGSSSDDSFWVRMNNGTWYQWNNIPTSSDFAWSQVHDSQNGDAVVSFYLSAGSNTLDIAYREDGTQLDKILIEQNGVDPTGTGGLAPGCAVEICDNEIDDDGDGDIDCDDSDCYTVAMSSTDIPKTIFCY